MEYGNWPKCGQNKAILCPCICAAMRYWHKVKSFSIGASHRRRTYASPRESMTSHCNTVTIGCSVGLRQCYLREVFLIFYALCYKTSKRNVQAFLTTQLESGNWRKKNMAWRLNSQPTPKRGVSAMQATSVAAILQLQIAIYTVLVTSYLRFSADAPRR